MTDVWINGLDLTTISRTRFQVSNQIPLLCARKGTVVTAKRFFSCNADKIINLRSCSNEREKLPLWTLRCSTSDFFCENFLLQRLHSCGFNPKLEIRFCIDKKSWESDFEKYLHDSQYVIAMTIVEHKICRNFYIHIWTEFPNVPEHVLRRWIYIGIPYCKYGRNDSEKNHLLQILISSSNHT